MILTSEPRTPAAHIVVYVEVCDWLQWGIASVHMTLTSEPCTPAAHIVYVEMCDWLQWGIAILSAAGGSVQGMYSGKVRSQLCLSGMFMLRLTVDSDDKMTA